MGSKKAALQNGLGTLIESEVVGKSRFIDLFAGSGAVSEYVASRHRVEVLATDLQSYSVALASGILLRDRVLKWESIWETWSSRALDIVKTKNVPVLEALTWARVRNYRKWCHDQQNLTVVSAYGGHYFSPLQALWIDALRSTLPSDKLERAASLSALIRAASQCAAAPGHTAQPFQPTRSAKPFLLEAWQKDIPIRTKKLLSEVASRFSLVKGKALVADAIDVAQSTSNCDLVFVDPPYSGVHYSRFYHVLETIATNYAGQVSGSGRYPNKTLRPTSEFSLKSKSKIALSTILETLAGNKSTVILTFPNHECSNGLSGKIVREVCSKNFSVTENSISSNFSTLGGSKGENKDDPGRRARHKTEELILLLRPK